MAGPDVAALAADLARAVELTMSATASQVDRLKAYTACESFKETSPLCAEAGLYLAAGNQHSPISRHFGLQLMEHTVKYRWTQISQQEKIFIKENAMKLLAAGGAGVEPHMKDALSRVIVEMVKREWPQQWPGLLAELSEACSFGETQTELVLLVFLRLVEDVALLQTLESNQRRKDIYQALTTNMALIFEFFLRLIELHVQRFRACSTENSGTSSTAAQAAAHCRVVQVVLLTLTGFVEWVAMAHIMAQNGRLLHILCLLLNDTAFQYAAAECLSQIVNRKGKLEERKPLLILFSDEAIQYLYSSAKNTNSNILDDQLYLFKKKLSQVLSGLCTQLGSLWGKDGLGRPMNFGIFLDAMLEFSAHPSLVLAHLANPLWNSMLKHDHISRDAVFISYIPRWLEYTAPRIVRVNYYGGANGAGEVRSPASSFYYHRVDFDSEEEYGTYFHRARSDFLDSFRQATCVAPLVMFSYVENWLIRCLQTPTPLPIPITTTTSSAVSSSNATTTSTSPTTAPGSPPNSSMSTASSVYLEWEAVSTFLESVLSRVLQAPERPSIAAGLRLLQLCLNFQAGDPLILSTLLSCVSALFVFLSMSSGQIASTAAGSAIAISGAALLPQVLDKIFSTLVYSPAGESIENRSRAVKNVRRHAASLMVKIGNKYPLLLLPLFEQIKATVEALCQEQKGPRHLSMLERVTLQEALLLISNHFGDYERQARFVGEVMESLSEDWRCMVQAGVFKGAVEFMAFVGLDKPTDISCPHKSSSPGTPSSSPPPSTIDFNENRSKLISAVNLLLGAVKRCACPDDPERALRGGFVVAVTESGNPVCRNPAAPHVVSLLPHILSLCKIFNEMFTPEAQALLNRHYKGCLNMNETDRSALLGIISHTPNYGTGLGSPLSMLAMNEADAHSTNPTPIERIQRYLMTLHENCYHLLGSVGPSLGRDLYTLPNLGPAVVSSVLQCLQYIPDFRLRPIIRVFLKPFIYSCPQTFYEPVLLPIVAHIAPIMLQRLHTNWQHVSQLVAQQAQHDNDTDGNTDTQEVLDDILTRALTREYVELLKVALVGGSLTPEPNPDAMDAEDIRTTVDSGAAITPTVNSGGGRSNLTAEVISDLGGLLLRSEQTCQSLVMAVLGALSWIDSMSSLKATLLTGSIVRFLHADGTLNSSMASHVMMTILRALNEHGQHEANQGALLTLGAQLYELLRPQHPAVMAVLQQIPGVNPLDLQKLDERIAANAAAGGTLKTGNKVEKVKKDLFKKITSHLIGRSVGQLFKKDVKIYDLPQLAFPTKQSSQKEVVADLRNLYNA